MCDKLEGAWGMCVIHVSLTSVRANRYWWNAMSAGGESLIV
jgi:hypothetical protein